MTTRFFTRAMFSAKRSSISCFMRHCVLPSNGAADKPKALTADVGLIRVVVRRGAPSNQRIAIHRHVVRARSAGLYP